MLKGKNIRSIGYDIDFSHIRSKGLSDLYTAIISVNIPTIFPGTNELTKSEIYKQFKIDLSHARFWPTQLHSLERREIDIQRGWLNPGSILIEFETRNHPEYGITFSNSVIKASGENKSVPDFFKVSHMTEKNIKKIPLQDIISNRVSVDVLNDKYLLVGFDYEDLDVFTTLNQEKVNGVFLHALLLATSLHSNENSVELVDSVLPDSLPF